MGRHRKRLITFAIPSNRSVEDKSKVIQNLFQKASDPSRIEIIFRVDNNHGEIKNYQSEQHYINTIKDFANEWRDNVKVIVGEPLYGYCSIGDYHNDILKEYTGDFLFLYNDDCTDISKRYDDNIEPYRNKVVVLNIDNRTNNFDFFVISRKFIELNNGVFQYSPFVNYDLTTWFDYFPDICHRVDIDVIHSPKAGFGRNVSQNLECLNIGDEDYIWNCKHLGKDGNVKKLKSDKNGLNKWIKLICIDIKNMKTKLMKNPKKLIYNPDEFGPDTWKGHDVSIGLPGQCKCCPITGEELLTIVKDSGLII
jgi:hypothetical protein